MSKVSIISLGCPKNLVDSEDLSRRFGEEGFLLTPEAEEAELLLVNTCGFIEAAKRESIEEILRLKEMKGKGKKLLVFGCLAKRYGHELKREIPEIDALWGVGEENKIIEYCKGFRAMGNRQRATGNGTIPLTYGQSPIASSFAYIKIAEGCSRGCTYCVIPSIRGPYRSIEPGRILKRAEEYIRSGVRELVLVAQDTGSYGKDSGYYPLSSLLRDISAITGDFWVRLLYLYPASIDGRLLSAISEAEKVCKYLDIPLQHSEDRILKAMGRGGTKEFYRRMIGGIREAIPDVTLRTTFIVGFPGETGDDFRGLRNFVEETRFDRLGVFMYSREEGTPAAKLKGGVSRGVKESRLNEIMKVQGLISLEKNRALIGKRLKAVVDEKDGNIVIARVASQAPEIDGVVFMEQQHGARRAVHGAGRKIPLRLSLAKGGCGDSSRLTPHDSLSLRVGDFITVKIVDAYDYDLKGVLID